MAYTTHEQEIYDHLRATLPRWLFQKDTAPEDVWGAIVKTFDAVRTQVDTWRAFAEILQATGVWLDQHARDRNLSRQASESDTALQQRVRTIEDVATAPALITAANDALVASGINTPAYIVNLRQDRAFLGTFTATGRAKAYCSRGYRCGPSARPMEFIVILPFGSAGGLANGITDTIRAKKAAGFKAIIEVRANP